MSEELAEFAPVPKVVRRGDRYDLIEEPGDSSLGRIKCFHGQVVCGDARFFRGRGWEEIGERDATVFVPPFLGVQGICLRALAYMMCLGEEGMKQSSGDAVLNANYVLARSVFPPFSPFPPPFPPPSECDSASFCLFWRV